MINESIPVEAFSYAIFKKLHLDPKAGNIFYTDVVIVYVFN